MAPVYLSDPSETLPAAAAPLCLNVEQQLNSGLYVFRTLLRIMMAALPQGKRLLLVPSP